MSPFLISILKGMGPRGPNESLVQSSDRRFPTARRTPPVVARLQLSKFPPHSPCPPTGSASGLLMRLRGTTEWGSDRRRDRLSESEGGRETCVYRKRTFPLAMSIAYCQRRTDGRGRGRRQHTNIARGQLGSGSARARACNQKEKVGSLSLPPSLQPSTHPGSSHCSHLPRCIACTLQIAHPFLPPRLFLIFTWLLSVRPSVRVRPPVGYRQHKRGLLLAVSPFVCLLKDLTLSLTHSLTPDSRRRRRSPSFPLLQLHSLLLPPAPRSPRPRPFLLP